MHAVLPRIALAQSGPHCLAGTQTNACSLEHHPSESLSLSIDVLEMTECVSVVADDSEKWVMVETHTLAKRAIAT